MSRYTSWKQKLCICWACYLESALMALSACHHIIEDVRSVITAALQEKDACLVAVSGDGTLSITDLRKMKVGSRKLCTGI